MIFRICPLTKSYLSILYRLAGLCIHHQPLDTHVRGLHVSQQGLLIVEPLLEEIKMFKIAINLTRLCPPTFASSLLGTCLQQLSSSVISNAFEWT